tara:strand:+ start:67 stop:351 length:285 start_codon:yes stop_codon:yes gene_type:complete
MGLGWKNSNKIRGRSSGYHPYTDKDMKHISFCIKKGIKIAVIPNWEGPNNEWRVELNINKKIHLDPEIYKADEAHAKMYEYAKYYYDKYNKSFK